MRFINNYRAIAIYSLIRRALASTNDAGFYMKSSYSTASCDGDVVSLFYMGFDSFNTCSFYNETGGSIRQVMNVGNNGNDFVFTSFNIIIRLKVLFISKEYVSYL